MKQKYFLILGLVVLLGIILISGCIQEKIDIGSTGGMPIKGAYDIYEIGQNIDSDSKAQQVFNENFDIIINATKQTLNSTICNIVENVSVCFNMNKVFSGITVSCIENNEILSDKIKFEKRTYQKDGKRFGSFWHDFDNFDKEQYTFKVYVINQGEEWKEENGEIYTSTTTCKDPSEAGDTNRETGELYCASGIVQSWKLSYGLKYIMDSKGIVYLAGGYCPKRPQ